MSLKEELLQIKTYEEYEPQREKFRSVVRDREVLEHLNMLYGKGYIVDTLCGCSFRISSRSFYQVNPVQTEKLYSLALSYAGLSGKESVWDLYCGIGTISLFLSGRASKVYGVEVVPQAIQSRMQQIMESPMQSSLLERQKRYCRNSMEEKMRYPILQAARSRAGKACFIRM